MEGSSRVEELNELEPFGVEFEGEEVEGLALVWMKGVAEHDGERITFKSAMGVAKAREMADAINGICDALEGRAS